MALNFQNTPVEIFQQKGLWVWWTQNGGLGTNPFNGVSEKGIDFANKFGTPIGAIQGGKVIVREHHNNSIGDLVVIQGVSGYWLYQHITSTLQVGDTVATGGVVGTENGLPVDQFSTGPHIEVRYSPTYNTKVDSWLQPWINPFQEFSFIGNIPDNSGIISGSSGTPPNGQPSGGPLTGVLNTNLLGNSDNSSPNTIAGFDFTRFIDAALLFIIGLTLFVVGGWLLLSHAQGNNVFTKSATGAIPA